MDKAYADYLSDLKNRIFKILPLCEEKNKHVDKYLDGIIHELKGLPTLYPCTLQTETAWYVKIMSSLYAFSENYTISELHSPRGVKNVRSQVFTMISLIEKERELVRNELF